MMMLLISRLAHLSSSRVGSVPDHTTKHTVAPSSCIPEQQALQSAISNQQSAMMIMRVLQWQAVGPGGCA